MTENVWEVAQEITQEEKQKQPDVHPVVLQLLKNREVTEPDAVKAFLNPDYARDIHHPNLFNNCVQAVETVFKHLSEGNKILVHGDYDADGISGASVLYSTLVDLIGKWNGENPPKKEQITVFLPDREKDGYGIAMHTVERFAGEGYKLMITVDCGISNKESIHKGYDLGMETIICDHHAMPAELPDRAILFHPGVPGESYPNKKLCGTGVAAKLCWALIEEAQVRKMDFPIGYEKWLLDYVAIATVTDVMPLLGENRTLEKFGLKVLNKTRRPGLQKLVEVAGIELGTINTWNIGFQIGPRINAAGRIASAMTSFELLTATNDVEATVRAQELDAINKERQKQSGALYKEALEQEVNDEDQLLVFMGENWAHGLVGLVAGKLNSHYGKPVFMVTKHGDKFSASGRSIKGFDITKAMHAGAEFYHKFGGHPEACGFTVIGEENFTGAMQAARVYAKEQLGDAVLKPTLNIDAELTVDEISSELLESLESLEPHGQGNPKPQFISAKVRVTQMMPVGKTGQHVRLKLADIGGDNSLDMICFRRPELLEEVSIGDKIDVVYELGFNEWNGNKKIQMIMVDWRK